MTISIEELNGSTWLHISWTPFGKPRHFVRIGYYK